MKTQILPKLSLPKLSFPKLSFRGARLMLANTLTVLGASAGMASASAYVGTMDTSSIWSIRSSLSTGPADETFFFGAPIPGLVPIVGDWDGNGSDTIGVYDPATSNFFLKNTNSSGAADRVFTFGAGGATPIAGDWNNDGVDTIGIYTPTTGMFFLRFTNTPGNADNTFEFGPAGGMPIIGDWNGDGIDTVGIYDQTSGAWFQTNNNQNGTADIPPYFYSFGSPENFRPISGDWDLDGDDSIGLFSPADAQWFLRDTNDSGVADYSFQFGAIGGAPVAGQIPEPAGLVLLSAGCMALIARRRA